MPNAAHEMLTPSQCVRGCLYGGALGDAFGLPIEFKSLNTIRAEHGPFGLTEPLLHNGQLIVSDDTQMTLFTLEGIIRGLQRNVNEPLNEEIRLAYVDWLSTQPDSGFEGQLRGSIALEKALQFSRAPGHTCISAIRAGAWGTPENKMGLS